MSTLTWRFDDGGRYEAFPTWPQKVGDCVPRALAIYTGVPYAKVYRAMAEKMRGMANVRSGWSGRRTHKHCATERACDKGTTDDAYAPFMHKHGIRCIWQAGHGKRGMTAQQAFEAFGDCILHSHGANGHHFACIKGGKLRDTWNGLRRGAHTRGPARYSRIYVWADHPAFRIGEHCQDIDGNYEDRPIPPTANYNPQGEIDREKAINRKAIDAMLAKLPPAAREQYGHLINA